MVRLDDAYRLLDEIGEVIETIEPSRREHASDLLDSAIELLTRLRKRLPPGEPGPPVLGPPVLNPTPLNRRRQRRTASKTTHPGVGPNQSITVGPNEVVILSSPSAVGGHPRPPGVVLAKQPLSEQKGRSF